MFIGVTHVIIIIICKCLPSLITLVYNSMFQHFQSSTYEFALDQTGVVAFEEEYCYCILTFVIACYCMLIFDASISTNIFEYIKILAKNPKQIWPV